MSPLERSNNIAARMGRWSASHWKTAVLRLARVRHRRDATIVRAVLLPATMKLLGDWNWYLPKWLEWLPRLEHEPRGPVPDATPARAS